MPRCFIKGNAANCSLTEPLAASRKYGMVRREKYNARPAALTTTFTTFGLPYSSGFVIGVAAVDISVCLSALATASITAGSIIGSSPWMFTIASQGQRAATWAIRSEPPGWLGEVISARQNSCATSQIRVSSVAPTTSASDLACWHRSTTCRINGLPAISASGFPGNRVEPYRAGIIPITFMPLLLPATAVNCTDEKQRSIKQNRAGKRLILQERDADGVRDGPWHRPGPGERQTGRTRGEREENKRRTRATREGSTHATPMQLACRWPVPGFGVAFQSLPAPDAR